MKTEISAGGVVVKKTGKTWEVLLIHDMKDQWAFPKGLIDRDENPETTAKREVREEVGLSVVKSIATLPAIGYMYKREGTLIRKTVHYFLFQYIGTEILKPQTEEGISGVRWVPITEAVSLVGYAKTNVPILQKAQQFLISYGH